MNRAAIAADTLRICETGIIQLGQGKAGYDFSMTLKQSVDRTELFIGTEPELELPMLAEYQTKISITNETSLEALERLSRAYNNAVSKSRNDWFGGLTEKILEPDEVLCLNFASAKNPGGGFLGGAQAQEESLARSSGLYKTLMSKPDFYAFHRRQHDLLYSHRMIYSPNVPVFKNDAGDLLEPYNAAFITCAAPNAGAIASNQAHSTHLIPTVLEERAALVLSLAALKEHRRLVLGAWGCGVFQNDPSMVARAFAGLLEGRFKNVFEEVVFAVYDRSKGQEVYTAFAEIFKEKES